jgi:hypothetical protein
MTTHLDEHEEIEQVASRLTDAFPSAPEAAVRTAITRAWSTFDGSKIRDFVPVLAERHAKAHLEVTTI